MQSSSFKKTQGLYQWMQRRGKSFSPQNVMSFVEKVDFFPCWPLSQEEKVKRERENF